MNDLRPWILCIALTWCALVAAPARSLTDDELATLRAWRDGSIQSDKAFALAAELGRENNLEAISALLEIKSSIAMNRFTHALHLPSPDIDTPAWEALALHVAQDPAFNGDANAWLTRQQFLQLIRNYHSPELFEAYYAGAKRRLTDTQTPPGEVPRFFSVDLGTLLPLRMPEVANLDERIAALLPLVNNPCDGVPLVRFLRRRGDVAAFPRIRELYLRATNGYGICNEQLAGEVAEFHSAAASEAMGRRVRWLADQQPSPPREAEIAASVKILGAQPPDTGVDLDALERDVTGKNSPPSVTAELRLLFDKARSSRARIEAMAPDDLAQWVAQGKVELVRSSIKRGADLNAIASAPDNHYGGMTLLDCALANEQWELARLLVDGGADVNKPDGNNDKKKPLHTISESKLPTADEVRADRMQTLLLLLSRGAQVDARDSLGRTPLHFAAESKNLDILNRLLAAGAAVDARDHFGDTPLHYAAREGNVQDIAQLIAGGAKVDTQTLQEPHSGAMPSTSIDPEDGQTPLHIAATLRKTDAAAFLLDHHARIDARTKLGITPLMLAGGRKNMDMVRLLVDRGADVSAAAPDGVTAILIAHENGDKEIEALLRSRGARLDPITLAKREVLSVIAAYLYGNMH